MQDKELGEYSPSHSSSSKQVPCSHELCVMGPNCKSPKGHCPYTVNYLSEDTSSSGFLFEDMLHLASVGGNKQGSPVQASIIIGCGSRQSGQYLDGIAPDGLMGLGPGDVSVPSLLSKSGLVPHSFSFCYDKHYSGRLYFGDQGPASQKSTSFLPLKGNRVAYIVEVENYCVGSSCLMQTGHKAQVDTGSSFTYLPNESYEQIVSEFHRQVNVTKIATQGFENCYKARSLNTMNIPSMKLVFSINQSFVIENPVFHIADDQGGVYCLGIQRMDVDTGIIGQNFLMGYRLVFDSEKLKLGWSTSDCQDISDDGEVHLTPPPSDASATPLPTNEQKQNPHGPAVPPAVAGRTPPKPSAASPPLNPYRYCIAVLPLLLWSAYITYII
ncbi:Aspartyl protease [Handroanthus impetiginosus]|uniref:Aspartyl protease n=1 Tax=Handroanthus impetiginosus TaxID=429701 RepID=A0A2G9GQ53_9LAMI|nr:Aspartyl protease [Handroanthus impetiginosus]